MNHRMDSRKEHAVGTARSCSAWLAATICLCIASHGAVAAHAAPMSHAATADPDAGRPSPVPAMTAPFRGQSGSMPLPGPFLVAPTCGSHCTKSAGRQLPSLPGPLMVAPISCGNACGIRSRSANAGQRVAPRLDIPSSQSGRDLRLVVAGGDPPTVVDACAGRKCRG
jgi:hypothetical protein